MNFNLVVKRLVLTIFFISGFSYSQPNFKFAVIGDYGEDNQAESDVADLINSWGVDFIVTVGDNYYGATDGNYSDSWQALDDGVGKYFHNWIKPYLGSYGNGSPDSNRFFPSLGNHDWYHQDSSDVYTDYFDLTQYNGTSSNERYYDFIWSNVHFFILSTYGNGLTEYTFPRHGNYGEPDGVVENSIQAQWLQTQLTSSDSSHWNVVITHHAPYSSSSEHGSEPAVQWPYKEWGADIVLCGHDHIYERLFVDNLIYFVNGLGGGSIYSFGNPVPGSQFRYNEDYGAMLFEVYNDSLNCKFLNRSNVLIDSYTLFRAGNPVNVTESSSNPGNFILYQNFPNPFNPETQITFHIPETTNVKISIYDLLGNEIAVLLNEEKNPGTYRIQLNLLTLSTGGNEMPSGIYFYKISTSKYSAVKKMVFLK